MNKTQEALRVEQALKLALGALEYDGLLKRKQAITAIRAALADHVEEDLKLVEQPAKCKHNVFSPYRCTQCEAEQPASNVNATGGPKAFFSLADQPAQQQSAERGEPVAFDVVCHNCGGDGFDRQDSNYRCTVCNGAGFIEKMLYTSPPASKPWVGLSYEEVKKLIEFGDYENDPQGFIEFVEAMLREKNE